MPGEPKSSGPPSRAPGIPIVFVSYAHADAEHLLLRQLLDDLRKHTDLSLWLDTEQINVGDSIIQRINRGVLYSDFFLFIISRNTRRLLWPNQELRLALSHQFTTMRAFVIPIRIDDAPVPSEIANVHFLDLWRDYDSGLRDLLERLLKKEDGALATFDIDTSLPQGSIIQISDSVYRRMIEHYSRHPEEITRIDRRKFEKLVAELFDGFGFEVELTKRTRDGGRDVIAIKHNHIALKFLIECKRPDPGGHVGVGAVRELYGVVTHERATKGILATTACFSPDAMLLFEDHKWELEPKDYKGLMEWIEAYKTIKKDGGRRDYP
jgi:HJR/Mrr/RecB family endonuclease